MSSPQQVTDRNRNNKEKEEPEHGGITTRSWWPWAKRLLHLGFFVLIAYLLLSQARSVQWEGVFETMLRRPVGELLTAAGFATASYALYSCFDLLGRHYTGHKLSTRKVMAVNFISYAFNLNLGTLIGGIAFRYRLYSRYGLTAEVITRVAAMSITTNWLGYLLLAGLIFCRPPFSLPPNWNISMDILRTFGVTLVAGALGYILLCTTARRRTWIVKGHELALPSSRLALLQLVMSCMNWMLMAAAICTLLEWQAPYPLVLGVLLIAAIAGVITHIPAGLGVLETVFISLLANHIPKSELLAALLTYRAIYYLAPLVVALAIYLIAEAHTSSRNSAVG